MSNKFINIKIYILLGEGDVPPTRWQKELRRVLLRAFNKNQILILSELENNRINSISSLLGGISKIYEIPLSTLKSNARILRELGLISYGNSSSFQVATLTEFGKFLAKLIGSWYNLASTEVLGTPDKGSNSFGLMKMRNMSECMIAQKMRIRRGTNLKGS